VITVGRTPCETIPSPAARDRYATGIGAVGSQSLVAIQHSRQKPDAWRTYEGI